MIAIAIIVAAYLCVGLVVALRAVPWADVSIHAPFARRTGGAHQDDPVVSPAADRLFFWLCVLLWPVAWRFRHLGAFAGEKERDGAAPALEVIDDADAAFLAGCFDVTPDQVRDHVARNLGTPVDDDGQAAAIAAAHKLLDERNGLQA